jgi:hypothetical protein
MINEVFDFFDFVGFMDITSTDNIDVVITGEIDIFDILTSQDSVGG